MNEYVINVGDDDFKEKVIEAKQLTIVDFWAEWCAPCKALGPILEDLANDHGGKVQIAKMDIDEHPQTPGEYGVRAIPTILLIKDGEVVEQLVGLVPKKKIDALVTKHL
ncbi:thioredoxin [Myxococcota bacterium]|nr:thioredoxin [Myxococcota bacterium]